MVKPPKWFSPVLCQDRGGVIWRLGLSKYAHQACFGVPKTRCLIANFFAKKVLMLYNENGSEVV